MASTVAANVFTYAEFKRNFPGLNILLYYSVKSQSRKFGGAIVLEKGQFVRFLKKLGPTEPASGRVVILTMYSTIQRRDVIKLSQRFKFVDPPSSTKRAKRRKVLEIPDSDDYMVRNSQDSDSSMSEDEGPSTVHTQSEKLRVYHPSDPEVKTRRITILSDADPRTPDGLLEQYEFVNDDLANIRWAIVHSSPDAP
ncbi:hypothetical protein TrVFT333_009838 [Trichoderma virens FT-333]|nr:hypothetical protein TrVFT333_009838 [Trichoderma virens FT-333]